MASGGRAPRSRTTRVAASRCSAGSTASRYGRPPRSGVAVEARKTVTAFKSGSFSFVGGIRPAPLLTRTAARGQERRECSPRTLRHRSAPSFARPLPRCSLPSELLLNRLGHEVLHVDLVRHTVQLEPAVKLFRDARRQLRQDFFGRFACHGARVPWRTMRGERRVATGAEPQGRATRKRTSKPSATAKVARKRVSWYRPPERRVECRERVSLARFPPL